MNASLFLSVIDEILTEGRQRNDNIAEIVIKMYSAIPIHDLNVEDRVYLSSHILRILSKTERRELAEKLLIQQVVRQRQMLSRWSLVTAQSSQIDTGYIAQHLVSLQTQIPGQGMRGKGDDLSDGSEVKSANFLDSLDRAGATAPRWNFTCINPQVMERFLTYESLFLVSMDLNEYGYFRTRIWRINVLEHQILRDRYQEWMHRLGYPKFQDTVNNPVVNFQLFPPRNRTGETFARHGNGRRDGFTRLEIPLEGVPGAELVFRADEEPEGINISTF